MPADAIPEPCRPAELLPNGRSASLEYGFSGGQIAVGSRRVISKGVWSDEPQQIRLRFLRGQRHHEVPAGGQRGQPGGDDRAGDPRASRFHRDHRRLRLLLRQRQVPRRADRRDRGPSAGPGEAHRQDPGRPGEPPAALGPLRRGVLHAGHDGHGPQPGPERRDGRGTGAGHRQSRASPTTPTAASSACSATWSWGSTRRRSRTLSPPRRPRSARLSTPTSPPTTCATSPCASRRSWASRPASSSRPTRSSSCT